MTLFWVTLSCVCTMLLYAVPGFAAVRAKLFRAEHIPVFSLLLMYVTAPALNVSAFLSADFTKDDIPTCLLFLLCGLLVQFGVMAVSYLLLRRKYADVRYKILTLATVLGNCGFMGIPLLRAVLPQYPLAVPLSTFFALGMNILLYTLGFFIISGDRKYVSLKTLLLNPATISVLTGFFLFILSVTTPFRVPALLTEAVTVLGNVSTPLCMLIIGMRLATVSWRQLVLEPVVYAAIVIKQIAVPLLVLGILKLLPLDPGFEQTLYVMVSVPVAAMILNASEVLHAGQKEAASIVLVSTITSVATIPLLMLLA